MLISSRNILSDTTRNYLIKYLGILHPTHVEIKATITPRTHLVPAFLNITLLYSIIFAFFDFSPFINSFVVNWHFKGEWEMMCVTNPPSLIGCPQYLFKSLFIENLFFLNGQHVSYHYFKVLLYLYLY